MKRLYFIKDIKKSGFICPKFYGEKRYIATGNVDIDEIKSNSLVSFKNKPSRANICVSIGDVLFAKMQNTKKVIEINEEKANCIFSTGFYCFKDERINPKLMKYYFLSDIFNIQKDKRCRGATMKAINDEGIAELSIPLYSDEMQNRIIKELDEISSIISLDIKRIKLYDELIKSRFITQEVLS